MYVLCNDLVKPVRRHTVPLFPLTYLQNKPTPSQSLALHKAQMMKNVKPNSSNKIYYAAECG